MTAELKANANQESVNFHGHPTQNRRSTATTIQVSQTNDVNFNWSVGNVLTATLSGLAHAPSLIIATPAGLCQFLADAKRKAQELHGDNIILVVPGQGSIFDDDPQVDTSLYRKLKELVVAAVNMAREKKSAFIDILKKSLVGLIAQLKAAVLPDPSREERRAEIERKERFKAIPKYPAPWAMLGPHQARHDEEFTFTDNKNVDSDAIATSTPSTRIELYQLNPLAKYDYDLIRNLLNQITGGNKVIYFQLTRGDGLRDPLAHNLLIHLDSPSNQVLPPDLRQVMDILQGRITSPIFQDLLVNSKEVVVTTSRNERGNAIVPSYAHEMDARYQLVRNFLDKAMAGNEMQFRQQAAEYGLDPAQTDNLLMHLTVPTDYAVGSDAVYRALEELYQLALGRMTA
jgi:hypothetical protein